MPEHDDIKLPQVANQRRESNIKISDAMRAMASVQFANRSENGDKFNLDSRIQIARRRSYTPGLRNMALTSISSRTVPSSTGRP
jgi:hypothetical protein